MIGLLYLVFFAVYLWLSILLIRWAARIAKKRGITGWKFGLPMALVMYLLVFWDWIPTVVAHKYYCSKYGGFTVYKTLDEWKKENPGVAETLININGQTETQGDRKNGYKSHKQINQRFSYHSEIIPNYGIMHIRQFSSEIADDMNNEVLIKRINFDTDIKVIGLGASELRDFKFWLNVESCRSNQNWVKKFQIYMNELKTLGDNNHGHK